MMLSNYSSDWWNILVKALELMHLHFHEKEKLQVDFEIGQGEGYHAPTTEDHYRFMYCEALYYAVSSIKD